MLCLAIGLYNWYECVWYQRPTLPETLKRGPSILGRNAWGGCEIHISSIFVPVACCQRCSQLPRHCKFTWCQWGRKASWVGRLASEVFSTSSWSTRRIVSCSLRRGHFSYSPLMYYYRLERSLNSARNLAVRDISFSTQALSLIRYYARFCFVQWISLTPDDDVDLVE